VNLFLADWGGIPEVTGWEVARLVQAERAQVSVILLTGWGDQRSQELTDGLEDRVLAKPCRIQEIQAAARGLVHPWYLSPAATSAPPGQEVSPLLRGPRSRPGQEV
jgi:DNA-binding response OmpR family regulator